MKTTRLLFLSTLILITAFWCSCTSGPRYQERTLPSGRTVKILGMMRMNFSQGPPALMLKYQTDLKVSDKDELRKEVDDIWTAFQEDADRGEFKSAIISVNEKPTGFIFTKSSGYNFVFEKRSDGQWYCLSDK